MNLFHHFSSRRTCPAPVPVNPAPAPIVDATLVRHFFCDDGFEVFAVSQSASGRWQVNLRGKSPLQAFGAASRFSDRYPGHRVQVLIG